MIIAITVYLFLRHAIHALKSMCVATHTNVESHALFFLNDVCHGSNTTCDSQTRSKDTASSGAAPVRREGQIWRLRLLFGSRSNTASRRNSQTFWKIVRSHKTFFRHLY